MPDPGPLAPRSAAANARQHAARKKITRAVVTWGSLALLSLSIVAALIVWHLVRRGRLIREGLRPPRVVRLPDPGRNEPDPDPGGP